MFRTRRYLWGLMAATAAIVAVTIASTQPAQAAGHSTKLLVRYATRSACTIVPNYPADGVVGNQSNQWDIPAGKTIIWRYNVNATWAAVSDPVRAAKGQFPWWGFTHRDCIGDSVKQSGYPAGVPVPSSILTGRSQHGSGWRTVQFSVPAAPVTAHHRALKANATLRDPANFVIGNAYAGWHVDVTAHTRSGGHWVEVYVPNAKRWGYIEASDLT
jgi:hypothetical protein